MPLHNKFPTTASVFIALRRDESLASALFGGQPLCPSWVLCRCHCVDTTECCFLVVCRLRLGTLQANASGACPEEFDSSCLLIVVLARKDAVLVGLTDRCGCVDGLQFIVDVFHMVDHSVGADA